MSDTSPSFFVLLCPLSRLSRLAPGAFRSSFRLLDADSETPRLLALNRGNQ